ncbi:MAG: HAD-IIIA family hydrolase [Chloroflexota bacterium]
MATDKPGRRAVFLDRDGVINHKPPDGAYVRSWSEFRFLPGALTALAELHASGATLLLVTNQRGVARGLIRPTDLAKIHAQLVAELAAVEVQLGGIYVCPHDAGECDCRKPDVGLFLRAQREHPWISFPNSDLIGDSLTDLEAGRRLGMRLWLVGDNEHAAATERDAQARAYILEGRAPSLLELVRHGGLLYGAEGSGR